jgi:hypothetical protein
MRDVMRAIEERTAVYEQNPLFDFLRDTRIEPGRRLSFAPSAAHYILTFTDFCQYVLREEPAKDRLQEIVNAQTYEEAEHSRWFISDLAKLGYDPVLKFSEALDFIWSPATNKSRILSYDLCRMALGANSLKKLVLVQCVEATAEVTVRHVMMVGKEWSAKTGQSLEFFGATHEDAEEHHSFREDSVSSVLEDIHLRDDVKLELLVMVEQAFSRFSDFASELLTVGKLERRIPVS